MKTYRIFLASSYRLAEEREALKSRIAWLNDDFSKRNVYLQLDIWEKFDSANDPIRKQNFYNEYIQKTDIFLVLYQKEIGSFTLEEYIRAQELFGSSGRPRIYLFKKTISVDHELNSVNVKNLHLLEEEWYAGEKEQWPWEFNNKTELTQKISDDIRGLFDNPALPHFSFPEVRKLSLNSPEMPLGFLGREEELITIYQKLNSGGKLMLINAEGGIGKTTLAAKYWNDALNNYKYAAWLFCEGGIVNSLKEMAPQLNIDLNGMDEHQQIQALKLGLHAVQNDFLLVLDNLNNEEDIHLFRQEFEGFHWHVLITSRCQGILEKEQELPIEHLPPPLAKELFERYYREDSDNFDDLLAQVLKAINYHTLLTEVFAKNLAEAAELGEMYLEAFLIRLEAEGLFLLEQSFEIENNEWAAKRKVATTDQILDALYDFGQLIEEQRYLLVNLALLPAESYTLVFINSLLADETIRTSRHIRDRIKELVKKGWINETDRSYRLSPVIQKLVLDKHADTLGEDSLKLLKMLNHITESDSFTHIRISLVDVMPYILPIFHLTQHLKINPSYEVAIYNLNAGVYYMNTGDLINAKRAFLNYQNIIIYHLPESPEDADMKNQLGMSYHHLGKAYEELGEIEQAMLNFQENHKILKEIYEEAPENQLYKNNLAQCYSKLGEIYKYRNDWGKALINFVEHNKLSKEVYENSPEIPLLKNNFAISYANLGEVYLFIGDWDRASLNFQMSIELLEEVCQDNHETLFYIYNLAGCYNQMAKIYTFYGDIENTLSSLEQNNKLIHEIYENSPKTLLYKNSLAQSYDSLGKFYMTVGNLEQALLNLMKGKELAEEVYNYSPESPVFKNNLAQSYSSLAIIYEEKNDLTNAKLNYKKNIELLKEVCQTTTEVLMYQYNLALAYSNLGKVYQSLNKLEKALFNFKESHLLVLHIYRSSPETIIYKHSVAVSHLALGGIYKDMTNLGESLLNFQKSNKIAKEVYERNIEIPEFKETLALSFLKLGIIYQVMNDSEKGILNYLENLKIRKEIYESNPNDAENEKLLDRSYNRLGEVYEEVGDFKNALSYYWDSQFLTKKLNKDIEQGLRNNWIIKATIKVLIFLMKITSALKKTRKSL